MFSENDFIRDIVTTPPLQAQRVGDDVHISIGGLEPIWAELIAKATVSAGGLERTAWRWREVIPQTGGTWQVVDGGASGNEQSCPAFEARSKPLAQVGDVAYLRPGRGASLDDEDDWGFSWYFTDSFPISYPVDEDLLSFAFVEDVCIETESDESLRYQGEWDNAANYDTGDMVTHNGATYVATADGVGNEPPDGAFWDAVGVDDITSGLDALGGITGTYGG